MVRWGLLVGVGVSKLVAVPFSEQPASWCRTESLQVLNFGYPGCRRFQTCMEVACRFAHA